MSSILSPFLSSNDSSTENQHILEYTYNANLTILGNIWRRWWDLCLNEWKHTVQTQPSRWKKSARSWKNCKRMHAPKKFIESTRKKMLLPKNKDKNYMEVVLEDRQVLRWRKPRIVLPYKHGDYERIWRILDPYDIQVYFKPRVTNNSHLIISCPKDPSRFNTKVELYIL